jgi:predicted Rossmann-fold nucleotide-binding protein
VLIQSAPPAPVVLFDEAYWRRIVNFDAMIEEGVISAEDMRLFEFADTAEAAWQSLLRRGLRDPVPSPLAGEGARATEAPAFVARADEGS